MCGLADEKSTSVAVGAAMDYGLNICPFSDFLKCLCEYLSFLPCRSYNIPFANLRCQVSGPISCAALRQQHSHSGCLEKGCRSRSFESDTMVQADDVRKSICGRCLPVAIRRTLLRAGKHQLDRTTRKRRNAPSGTTKYDTIRLRYAISTCARKPT